MFTFTKNVVITVGSRVLVFMINLSSSIIIARMLGPERNGIYSLAFLLPSLLTTFTCFGIAPATAYYVGQNKYSLKEIFGNNILLSLVIGATSVVIGLIFIFLFQDIAFPGVSRFYLVVALPLIPLNLFFTYIQYMYLGTQQIKEFNFTAIIQAILFLALVSIALFIFNAGIIGVLTANILALFLNNILLFMRVRKTLNGVCFKINLSYYKDVLLYGFKAQLNNILNFMHFRLDMLLMNVFMDPSAVGYYSVAVGIAERLKLISQSAGMVLFPKIASEDDKHRKEFTPIVSRNILLITTVAAICIFFLSRWVVLVLYSEAYLKSVRPLQFLLPGIVALSICAILSNDVAGRGRPMLNTYFAAVTLIINLILNILWIPQYGIEGAALASTVSYTAQMIGRLFVYSKISGNSIAKIIFIQKSDIVLYRSFISVLAKRPMADKQ